MRRHRRPLGALLLAAAALVAVQQLRPAPPPTSPVVVAARDLPAGTRLQGSDLAVRRLPDDAVPPSALPDPALAEGATIAAPMTRGEPLSRTRLRGPGLLHGQPEGTVALPIRVADAAATGLLTPGDRIDLLAAVPGAEGSVGVVVAEALPVLLVGGADATSAAPGLIAGGESADPLAGSGAPGGLVVVATSPAQARDLVSAGADAPLWFALTWP